MAKVCPHCHVAQSITKYGRDRNGNQRCLCGACSHTFLDKRKPKASGKKPARKGVKSTRGRPEIHDELKGKVSLSLTPTGVVGLDTIAGSMGLSRSELVEQVGRGLIPLSQAVRSTPD